MTSVIQFLLVWISRLYSLTIFIYMIYDFFVNPRPFAEFGFLDYSQLFAFVLILGFKNSMERFYIKDFKLSNKDAYKYSIIMALLFLIALFKGSIQEYSEFIYFNFYERSQCGDYY